MDSLLVHWNRIHGIFKFKRRRKFIAKIVLDSIHNMRHANFVTRRAYFDFGAIGPCVARMWSSSSPQEVLCRVDVGGCIWLLVRFSGDVKRWESFPDVSAMTTYLERGSQTLLCPAKCLLPEQAQRLVSRLCQHWWLVADILCRLSPAMQVTDAKRRISKLENEVTRYEFALIIHHFNFSRCRRLVL